MTASSSSRADTPSLIISITCLVDALISNQLAVHQHTACSYTINDRNHGLRTISSILDPSDYVASLHCSLFPQLSMASRTRMLPPDYLAKLSDTVLWVKTRLFSVSVSSSYPRQHHVGHGCFRTSLDGHKLCGDGSHGAFSHFRYREQAV